MKSEREEAFLKLVFFRSDLESKFPFQRSAFVKKII